MEGDELCNLYFDSGKVFFGVSTLPAAMKGTVDVGHKDAFEVFFVAGGKVLCYLPDKRDYIELDQGDAILIPPEQAHQLINIGEETATVTWAQFKT